MSKNIQTQYNKNNEATKSILIEYKNLDIDRERS